MKKTDKRSYLKDEFIFEIGDQIDAFSDNLFYMVIDCLYDYMEKFHPDIKRADFVDNFEAYFEKWVNKK